MTLAEPRESTSRHAQYLTGPMTVSEGGQGPGWQMMDNDTATGTGPQDPALTALPHQREEDWGRG